MSDEAMIRDAQRMYDALKLIASYDSPAVIRKHSERRYGLEPNEALEMAYENVLFEAKAVLRGMKRPKETTDKCRPSGRGSIVSEALNDLGVKG